MSKISAKERRKLDLERERRKDKLRRKYPEIRGKVLDYVTHSYEDGWVYVTLNFTDGTNFSLDFTMNEPAIVPKFIEFGKYVDGDYESIRTHYHRKEKDRWASGRCRSPSGSRPPQVQAPVLRNPDGNYRRKTERKAVE